MRTALKVFFVFVLAVMTWGTMRASLDRGIVTALQELGPDTWFQVTLLDTYFAFLTFSIWVLYKETCWMRRLLWLGGILLLGNFAIAAYMLLQLFRLPAGEPLENLLLRRKTV